MKSSVITLWLVAALLFAVDVRSYDQQDIHSVTKKGYLLSDTEVARIKEEIRIRCRLRQADEAAYPWYYHYEVGLAMKKKNDWQRALDSFLVALDHRDRPQRLSRIYGMWFMDYFPYYNIGLAHYHLQNWKCAVNSFQLSQMLEDIPSGSVEFRRLHELESAADANLSGSERDD